MFTLACRIIFSIVLIFDFNTEVSGGTVPSPCRMRCPPVPPGTISHCAELCTPGSCKYGLLCCSIGCGKDCIKGSLVCG
ncbi:Hypothetical predicted protein [Mytilus galloprovincialis]|uniref:WAP domain-containing protein n=1 Tax=Mytilus galloprovincialis TaxID=29158 RepID=A0A8B6FH56_MYTGA|nr:Hypothetical predicted protein [Mytilus galloprovincialis]